MFGTVTFERRYYRDLETGQYVYLLDRVLEIEGERISPNLGQIAVIQAVISPSCRAASESLEQAFGQKVLSHEAIRQLLIQVGKRIEQEERKRRKHPKGKRKVRTLYIEADGLWVKMQRDKKKRREIHMMVSHESWCPRHPASSEYELIHKVHHFEVDAKDFWEDASRLLHNRYDIDENTMVVINGDRASWIRKGVEYFPKAIYQFDRFHLKKEINELIKNGKEHTKAIQAINGNDPTALLVSLAIAESRARDTKKRERIRNFKEDILSNPEAARDYRVRLKEMGYDTKGMRGLGAAESNVDRFSNRLKKRGQSWRMEGLTAMVYSLINRFEGKLEGYAKNVLRRYESLSLKTSLLQVPVG